MSFTVSTSPVHGGIAGASPKKPQDALSFLGSNYLNGGNLFFSTSKKYSDQLSDEYKANMQELQEMKEAFYAAHKLPEDDREINPLGTIGLLQGKTEAQKQRDELWEQEKENYMAAHPISEADQQVLDAQKDEFRKISVLC